VKKNEWLVNEGKNKILACCSTSGDHKLKCASIEKCKETYGYKYSYKNISSLI
jgi:hypothetical protein